MNKFTKRWNLFDITFFGKFNLNFDRYYYFGSILGKYLICCFEVLRKCWLWRRELLGIFLEIHQLPKLPNKLTKHINLITLCLINILTTQLTPLTDQTKRFPIKIKINKESFNFHPESFPRKKSLFTYNLRINVIKNERFLWDFGSFSRIHLRATNDFYRCQ